MLDKKNKNPIIIVNSNLPKKKTSKLFFIWKFHSSVLKRLKIDIKYIAKKELIAKLPFKNQNNIFIFCAVWVH